MKTTALCFLLLSSVAFAGPALQGTVRDPSGKPIRGADVRIEAKNGKVVTTKTDGKGQYVANDLAAETYKVTLLVNGAIKASILNTTTKAGGPTTLNFDLKQEKGPSKRHMVYIPQETGSHIGNGKWVVVDENGTVINDDSNVQTMNSNSARQMQINRAGSRGGQ
jgi:nitric oxide reductase large subunit